MIRRKAKAAKMSITDYVISAATGKEIVNFEGLGDLVSQLKRLGNNLNQLVILARQERVQVLNLAPTFVELGKIHDELSAVLKQGR